MAVSLAVSPYQQYFDNNGNPLSLGLIYTYSAGTTTPKDTYTDSSGTIPSANPIVLDSAGRAVWYAEGSYRYDVYNSGGALIRSVDNVTTFSTDSGLAILGNIATKTIVGNATGASATPAALTTSQVFGLLNMSPLPSIISGLIISSISGTSTTASLSISAGCATDSGGSVFIGSSSTLNWAVSNGNAANGYQGGTTLPNSSTIHFFVMWGTLGVASFGHNGLTPTLPSGYTNYRRIGSLRTTSAGALIPVQNVTEIGGGATINYLSTSTLDINVSNLGTSATLYVLSVPSGLRFQPIYRSTVVTNPMLLMLSCPDEPDAAVSGSAAPLFDAQNAGFDNGVATFLVTDTSSQIRARSNSTSGTFRFATRGWIDFRR